MRNLIKRTYLECTAGSSNKFYEAFLFEVNPGEFTVEGEYGAIGQAPKKAVKTKTPVPFTKAEIIFDKLVAEKLKKQYVVFGNSQGSSTASPAPTPVEQKKLVETDIQLLNPIKLSELKAFAASGKYLLQAKHDGVRAGAHCNGSETAFYNRSGEIAIARQEFHDSLSKIKDALQWETMHVDGELLGNTYVIFDVLRAGVTNLKPKTFVERNAVLREIRMAAKSLNITNVYVDVAVPAAENIDKYLKEYANDEGLVLKEAGAPYTNGRPNKGGVALKYKFVESATVRVASMNEGKRSVAIEMEKDGEWVGVGNVTIPANADIPNVNHLIEVQYLYAYPDGGSLFQPVFKMPRFDVGEEACDYSSLKFKSEENPREAANDASGEGLKPYDLAIKW